MRSARVGSHPIRYGKPVPFHSNGSRFMVECFRLLGPPLGLTLRPSLGAAVPEVFVGGRGHE